MEKVIIHVINFEIIKTNIFREDLLLLKEINEKYLIKNIFFYSTWKLVNIPDEYINNEQLEFFDYKDFDDLSNKVLNINKNFEIIFINTLLELEIQTINKLRILIGQEVSTHYEMFNNKSIQRELLYNNDSYISVKFIKSKLLDLNYDEIVTKIWLPFVLKPSRWVQSAWVVKIKKEKNFIKYIENYKVFHSNLVNKWLNDIDEIIAEEYVNWKFYSIDYFVNEKSEIFLTKPVKVELWIDLWIDDFFNYSRIISKEVEKENDENKLYDFIQKNVKATGIKNTFIHHEYKINTKWQYKTIELNGRIGWRRLPYYKMWYNLNLFTLLFEKQNEYKLNINLAFLRVYACKTWILKEFNQNLFDQISKLSSSVYISKNQSKINKKVWLTKYWFENTASLRLQNDKLDLLKKDLLFIWKIYQDLLIIDENKEFLENDLKLLNKIV